MATLSLSADKRTVIGRKVKSLRREGVLPANVFGKKVTSQSVQVDLSEFNKLYQEAGETNVIELKIKGDKDTRPVLVSNLQVSPITDLPLHVDFHQVDLKEKVTATVPVETVGEAPAVKEKDGVMFLSHNELEVEALPMDLPNKIEVDISGLTEIGDSILVKDLNLDRSKVTLELEDDETIVTVQAQKEEAEEEPAAPAEAEADETQTAPAEGEEVPEGKDEKETEPAEDKKE